MYVVVTVFALLFRVRETHLEYGGTYRIGHEPPPQQIHYRRVRP